MYMEHSPEQITSWVTNQALINLKKKKKKKEIVVSIFSDHNAIQSHINYRGKIT